MTPAFLFEGDWLLRAQLRCLSEQVAKDFDVLLVDHHYSKRKGYVPEFAEHYKLNIVHVPYTPNTHVAKQLDCAVFNAAYCYSESPRIVRYSCWRFVRPEFTKTCLESPTNVDFMFHSCAAPTPEVKHPDTDHNTLIWDTTNDLVNWSQVPSWAGKPGATWTVDSDTDWPEQIFPLTCYGNYMVFRDQWINVNGCDETWSNVAHYEDMEFTTRAVNAGMTCWRKAHQMFRLHHWYGEKSGRANIAPDVEFTRNCRECEKASTTYEPNRFDIASRSLKGEIEILHGYRVWVCKTCHLCGPIYHRDPCEHLDPIRVLKVTRSNIISKYKLGRNLRVLAADMDGKSLPEKIATFNDSWTNPKYYEN